MVEDRELLVLGGLIQDSETDTETKVPLLGDIPLLGWLFRDDSRSTDQSVLMMFIRPTILRTSEDAREISTQRFDYLRGYQIEGERNSDASMSEEIFDMFDTENSQE